MEALMIAANEAAQNNRSFLITKSDEGSWFNHNADVYSIEEFMDIRSEELTDEQKLKMLQKLNDAGTKNGYMVDIPYEEGFDSWEKLPWHVFALKTQ